MKMKEEILQEQLIKYGLNAKMPFSKNAVLDAMQQYADQEVSRAELPVKPACEMEKIFETESRSNTKTREDTQVIVGESGTRIFIDWRKREFSITRDESKSV